MVSSKQNDTNINDQNGSSKSSTAITKKQRTPETKRKVEKKRDAAPRRKRKESK